MSTDDKFYMKKKIVYKGYVYLKTGLHIGGSNSSLNIGGPDNFVVRNPLDNRPYIPGSSLKGKMRSLIEFAYGEINVITITDEKKNKIYQKGGPSNVATSRSGALFGVAGDNEKCRPSRLIVRDANLAVSGDQDLAEYDLTDEMMPDFSHTDMPYTEIKAEVNIDRITSKPASGPRQTERVPAGAYFKLEMVLNVFSGDEEDELKKTMNKAIELLQNDFLGGSGSRGYGQVEIKLLSPKIVLDTETKN